MQWVADLPAVVQNRISRPEAGKLCIMMDELVGWRVRLGKRDTSNAVNEAILSSKKGSGLDNDGLGKGFSDATLSFGLAHAGERDALSDRENLDGPATLVREYSERAVGEARRELTWIKRGTLASRQALAMAMAPCTLTLRMVKLLGV